MFQSIAGTEKALRSFGVTLAMLDEAHDMTRKLGQAPGPNVMYFETGQGSALSADAHEGADQMTLEARNYGLARHYSPFLVNTVVGFIGPEYLYDARQITRAGLEDHFMGKLHGIPWAATPATPTTPTPIRTTSRTWRCCWPPPAATSSWACRWATTSCSTTSRRRSTTTRRCASCWPAPGARVRGLAGGDGHHATTAS